MDNETSRRGAKVVDESQLSSQTQAEHATEDRAALEETTNFDSTDELLGQELDRHLDGLRSPNAAGRAVVGGDADTSKLAAIVEKLYTLSTSLANPPAQQETMDAPAGYPDFSKDHGSGGLTTRIGKYQVVRPIGAGGQASAVLAFDPDLRRHVVIKLFREARTPESQEMVLREGQALARVRSPFVAQCHSVERNKDGVPYLVVEYIPGNNLFEVHRAKPLNVEQAMELVAQVAEGLSAVHTCGLLHRDVKPTNIVVGDDGLPRLVDFGLATPLAGDSLRSISGTLAYMAPEQARAESERIDQRSDIFGLGAVLYFLLTGEPPHKANDRDSLWKLACAGDVVPPIQRNPKVPPAVNKICMRCLAKAPSNRFASASDLVRAVRAWQRPMFGMNFMPRSWVGRSAVAATIIFLAAAPLAIWFMLRGDNSGGDLGSGHAAAPNTPDAVKTVNRHNDGRPVRQDFNIQLEPVGGVVEPTGRILLADGERIKFKVKSERDAYIAVWYVPDDGAIVQLFPNKYEANHAVKAGEWRTIPAPELGYYIKAEPSTGPEHILVVASTRYWAPDNNHRGGYVVHESPTERSAWNDTVRGLALEADDAKKDKPPEKLERKVSEMIVPFYVRGKQ